jgi:hypothetical protein
MASVWSEGHLQATSRRGCGCIGCVETPENKKHDKKKDTLRLILLSKKKKQVSLSLIVSFSPFLDLRAGMPSAWCSQHPRQ